MKKKSFLENDKTRHLYDVLNLPEIRSGRIKTSFAAGTASMFKVGKQARINSALFDEFKAELNVFSVTLSAFTNVAVKSNDAYFKRFLDVTDLEILNFQQVYRNISYRLPSCPHSAVLRWSYYRNSKTGASVQEPTGEIVERFKPFFEEFRYELMILAKKTKI